jgi:succinate dehydrogenase / fumarate reductase iron-sulfur subunit
VSAGAAGGSAAGAATATAASAAAGAAPAAAEHAAEAILTVFRGDAKGGSEVEYRVPVEPGMVVLDAIHWIQAHRAPDLAVRWNCKAAKCGSCSAEVNGKPALMCKSRMDHFEPGKPISVRPMKTFPIIRDLVTDVSWNYEINRRITPFTPRPGAEWRWQQHDIDRAQEFRKCIECFLCQDVCHVLRTHELKHQFAGPRFFVRIAGLEMHPIDGADRSEYLRDQAGLGLCNITKCCTEVCPEEITITDNAIIPLKERVVDRFYDPVAKLWRIVTGKE